LAVVFIFVFENLTLEPVFNLLLCFAIEHLSLLSSNVVFE